MISTVRSRLTTSLTIVALFCGVPALATSVGESASPRIVAPEPHVDLGIITKGEKVTHEFVLRNESDEPASIAKVASSCGCTVTEHDDVIPARGEGRVEAVVDTQALTGEGTGRLRVFLDGQREPAATLTFRYNVQSKMSAHPGYARWIYVQGEEEGTIPQTVFALDGKPFEVTGVEPPNPHVEVTFRRATEDERRDDIEGSQWIVSPTLKSGVPVGPLTGFIAVHTTHPEQPLVEIPISGFVRPTLFMEPPDGHLGKIRLDEPRRATYKVRNFASDPIHLTAAETTIDGAEASIEPIEEGRRYRVVVRFDPKRVKEGNFRGTLTVKTDSEVAPMLLRELTGTFIRPESTAANS